MVKFKVPGIKSWFDPMSSKALATGLLERLGARMKGKRGLFITLTYRREEYQSPLDLFRCQQERQDVPLFMRRLQRYLGVSLKGMWLRKLEFQAGGWVHFHLVLDYDGFIAHSKLLELWGYGHVWVNRWNSKRARYVCKYMSKAGEVPEWILLEKPRSVKVVAVSPGFWGQVEYKRYPAKVHFWRGLGAYVPIGQRLQDARGRVLMKCGDSIREVEGDIGSLCVALLESGVELSGEGGWMIADCSVDLFEIVAGTVRSEAEHGTAALHLTSKRNPDVPGYLKWAMLALLDERRAVA